MRPDIENACCQQIWLAIRTLQRGNAKRERLILKLGGEVPPAMEPPVMVSARNGVRDLLRPPFS